MSDCTNKLCYITECLYSEPGYFRTISKPFAFLNNWFDCWLAFVSLYWWSIYLFSSTFYLVPLNPREKSETPYYNWRRYSSSMPALAAIPHRVSFSKRGLLKNTAEYLVTFSLSVVSGCLRRPLLASALPQYSTAANFLKIHSWRDIRYNIVLNTTWRSNGYHLQLLPFSLILYNTLLCGAWILSQMVFWSCKGLETLQYTGILIFKFV